LANTPFAPDERLTLTECQLLTAKPVLFVANVSEGANADEPLVARGGQLEAELSTLPENERAKR
jgi:ribosome-binding ATPase YchF (GTP1/OBG family)